MRILQLTSDWKWTGPAAPMLELLRAQRALGHRVDLVCPRPPPGEPDGVWLRAERAGVSPVLELRRARGVIWWRDAADARRLGALVQGAGYDVLHAWHTRDHVLAFRAAGSRRADDRTRLVRSFSRAEALPATPWGRWLFGTASDAILCVSPRTAERNQWIGRPVRGVFGAVDLARFRPGAPDPALRAALGLGPEHRVLGIAARVQRHRRFELLVAALRLLLERDPQVRLLVLGRGTHLEAALRQPARRQGVADRVVFAGYRSDDYPEALRCLDVFTLLVPGSDGGCRALLEAQATGLAAVVARRGALPEIVDPGRTGLVVDERPEALADAAFALLSDAPRRAAMGRAARERAEALFAPERVAAEVDALYRAALPAPAAPPQNV